MVFFSRVFAVRLWKPFTRRDRDATQADMTVRDRIPNHSIAAGISTIPMVMATSVPKATVTTDQQLDHLGHPSTSTPQNNSSLHRANNAALQGFSILSPIAGAIPVAGTPLKASIDALLIVLNGIKQKGQNRENAAHLTRRLYRLNNAITTVPPVTPSAQYQREELARKLDTISARLKQLDVGSVFGSADVAQVILDCIREIDEHELDYIVLAIMRMECSMQGFPAFLDNQGQLPASVQQGIIYVMDAAGRDHRLLIDQCESREDFARVLGCYFRGGEKDRVLRHFMERGTYELYIEAEASTTRVDSWSQVRPGVRIVMSVVLEQRQRGKQYRCLRCKTRNERKEANDGWIDW